MNKKFERFSLFLLIFTTDACGALARKWKAKVFTPQSLQLAMQLTAQIGVGYLGAKVLYDRKVKGLEKLKQGSNGKQKSKIPYTLINFACYFSMLAIPKLLHDSMGNKEYFLLHYSAYLLGWVIYETEQQTTSPAFWVGASESLQTTIKLLAPMVVQLLSFLNVVRSLWSGASRS